MPVVDMKVLEDGRVRIHWFCFQEDGPATTSKGKLKSSMGMIDVSGKKGFIACDKKRVSIQPSREGSVIKPFVHTDDPRAATCPECLATKEYKAAMASMEREGDKAKIHWFKRDEAKPVLETGHIACEPKRTFNPSVGTDKKLSDDPRAATCQECRVTEEYFIAMTELERLESLRVG